MARLCRAHFAGLGEACARFNPLTLDFRNTKTGESRDSVVWLRNGGGKTTLISLLYSVLVPNQNLFLGRLLGRDTSIVDFLRPNELGIVVTEWEFPALGTAKRIVGQIMLRKDRELKRRFFSFYSIEGAGFEQLPVLGLGTPARSIDAFLDALRDAERRHGARMDLVIPEDQHGWEKHLDERGLDPFLFRVHLKMNKQEGGASDLFKLKSAEEFLRLFLELVFDERATEELEKSLGELREKIARAPDRQAAVTFGEELIQVLRPFARDVAERTRLKEERVEITKEVTSLCAAIAAFLAELQQRKGVLEDEQVEVDEKISDLERQRSQHSRYRGGYDRLGRELRVQETERDWNRAKEIEATAQKRQRLLEAAVAWRSLSQKEAELRACIEQLEALRVEHRPELELILHLGAELIAAWDAKIEELRNAQERAKEKQTEARSALAVINKERIRLSAEKATAEANRETANSALTRHNEARRRLREEDILEPTESGKTAMIRWQKRVEELEAAESKLRVEAQELNRALADLITEESEAQKEQRRRDSELKEAKDKIRDEEKERERVSDLPAVRDLCEGAKPDLRNPHLLTQLGSLHETAEARLVEIGIANEEDRRSLQHLEREGLLAPALDVADVIRRLHDSGVRSALSVYRWLAEHHSVSDALEMLRSHPAAYGGILVQNAIELEKAQNTIKELEIKTPVLLVTPETLPRLGEQPKGSHTIVPSDHGLFSTKEASLARPQLEERRLVRDNERDAVSVKAKQAHESTVNVRQFIASWPQSRLEELHRKVKECADELTELESRISEYQNKAIDKKSLLDANQASQLLSAKEIATVRGYAQQLRTFVSEHENHVERWKNTLDSSVKELDEIAQNIRLLDEEEPRVEEMERVATSMWLETGSQLGTARKSRDETPSEFVGPKFMGTLSRAPLEIDPEFRNKIQNYEGKIQKGPLEGRIQELQRITAEHRTHFERVRGSLQQKDVEEAATTTAIESELEAQKQAVVEARAASSNAKRDYDTAFARRPDARDFKEGSDTNDALFPRPQTFLKCEELVAAIEKKVQDLGGDIADKKLHSANIKQSLERNNARRPLYKSFQDRLQRADTNGVAAHPKFSDNDDANSTLVDSVAARSEQNESSLNKLQDGLRRRFDKEIHPLVTHERFAKRSIPFRERLQRLSFEDFAGQAEQQLKAVNEQIIVCQAELQAQEQEKGILIQKLDTVARQSAQLFDQAARVSELPETLGAWARQPFLRISLPRKGDPAERHVLLSQAVERWFQPGQNIPKGFELAFECLIALCGVKTANIRILKPEYQLRAVSYDIMDLVNKFSDGEKLTAAILLYCVLVRLRARQKARAEQLLDSDAGLLLLDNPFGKATLATFVDLQVRIARLMGVQLVYSTGINDFSALKHFSHYVRLRNSSRGRATNDYHVTNDPRPIADERVDGIVLGFAANGRAQNK